jgi:Na+/H+-dicarboxylate symporter
MPLTTKMAVIFVTGIDLSKEAQLVAIIFTVIAGISFASNPKAFIVFPYAIVPRTGVALCALILGLFSLLERRRTRKQEAEASGIPA